MSRTVVLVHGAFHGSWCWEPVVTRLDAAGRSSVAVDLPSVSSARASLADDVACVRAALDAVDGEALLVGHAYGGVVVTDAGRHPAVAHIAYLTAFALEPGESANENTLTGRSRPRTRCAPTTARSRSRCNGRTRRASATRSSGRRATRRS
jgi:pimeloyl-ACP methyl ester carboxylesterase